MIPMHRILLASVTVAIAAAAPAVLAQNDDGSSTTHGPHKPGTPPTGSKDAGAVNQANTEADQAAEKTNESVVGAPTQNANEERARKANEERKAYEQREMERSRTRGSTNMQKPGSAAAQAGEATTNATSGVEKGVEDVTRSTDISGHYDPFAIELNPLGLFVGGRVSLSAEWVPTTHHAIEVSPHIVHTTADVATSGSTTESQAFSGFGGEVGYRYYTGHRGPNGVFIGPSLIAGIYNAGLPSGNQAFTDIGIAADVGVQQIFWDHLVVGGGLGVEYLSVSHDFHDLPTGPSTIASTGVKPRFLLEAGYGF